MCGGGGGIDQNLTHVTCVTFRGRFGSTQTTPIPPLISPLLSASTNEDSDLFHGDDSVPNALLTPSPTKHWKLLYNDLLCNQNMRRSFHYKQTPNLSLALAIIDLMASKCGAAAFILDCCLTMSVRILPDSQGCVNAELDHDFVIGYVCGMW